MKTQKEKHFENYDVMMSVFGELDENIERLTDAFDVDVFAMGTGVKVSGEERTSKARSELSTRLKSCAKSNRFLRRA